MSLLILYRAEVATTSISGSGGTSFGVPSLTGTGIYHAPAASGGSRFTVKTNTSRFVPDWIWPVVKIAGTGRFSARGSSTAGTGTLAIASGSGPVQMCFGLSGSGSHRIPIIAGHGASASRVAITASGFHDIRPVEDEELMLMMAA